MKDHLVLMARYNAWANARLYAAAGGLPDADYRADRGVFFRSMHGTLNHILVADLLWMRRVSGTGEVPTRLDAILYDAFEPLARARTTEDARILAYVEGAPEDDLQSTMRYTPVSGTPTYEQPRASALLHMFNHQTHHRGQAHAILTGFSREAPALDLAFFQRDSGIVRAVS